MILRTMSMLWIFRLLRRIFRRLLNTVQIVIF